MYKIQKNKNKNSILTLISHVAKKKSYESKQPCRETLVNIKTSKALIQILNPNL